MGGITFGNPHDHAADLHATSDPEGHSEVLDKTSEDERGKGLFEKAGLKGMGGRPAG